MGGIMCAVASVIDDRFHGLRTVQYQAVPRIASSSLSVQHRPAMPPLTATERQKLLLQQEIAKLSGKLQDSQRY